MNGKKTGRTLSRRASLGGAMSFGALAGCRAFRAPTEMISGDGASLTLGVMSENGRGHG